MDRILFTAAGGASRTLEHQAVVSHNLANASTAGFRAQLAHYRAVPIVGPGLPTRVASVTATPGSDFTAGPLQTTGRDLDIAIDGEGFLAVRAADGSTAFTRAGGLQIGADGQLLSPQGHPVLSDADQPLTVPAAARLTVGSDGTLYALGAGDAAGAQVALGRLKLVAPETAGLARGGDGLFRRTGDDADAPLAPAPQVRVLAGVLEGSNVNPIDAMVNLIDNGRRFDMQMKVVQHADTNADRANRLLAANG